MQNSNRKKKKKKRKESIPYEDTFKNRIKEYFSPFARVHLEEDKEPIIEHVALFTYFKKWNMIDFKSEGDRFSQEDFYKMGHYINGFFLNQKKCKEEELTYTLVTTRNR